MCSGALALCQQCRRGGARSRFGNRSSSRGAEFKIEIFTLLDKICRPGTILASNTSSLSVTEIASVTYRPAKCLGMHFFNPVHKMKLIEIVRARETDEERSKERRVGKECRSRWS